VRVGLGSVRAAGYSATGLFIVGFLILKLSQ